MRDGSSAGRGASPPPRIPGWVPREVPDGWTREEFYACMGMIEGLGEWVLSGEDKRFRAKGVSATAKKPLDDLREDLHDHDTVAMFQAHPTLVAEAVRAALRQMGQWPFDDEGRWTGKPSRSTGGLDG
jgi:hypothetical protein